MQEFELFRKVQGSGQILEQHPKAPCIYIAYVLRPYSTCITHPSKGLSVYYVGARSLWVISPSSERIRTTLLRCLLWYSRYVVVDRACVVFRRNENNKMNNSNNKDVPRQTPLHVFSPYKGVSEN